MKGFGSTATSIASSVNSAFSGMAGAIGSALAPIGKIFEQVFIATVRTLTRQALRAIEDFIQGVAQAAVEGSHLEDSLSRLGETMNSVAKSAFAPFVDRLGEMVDSAAPAFLGIVQAAETYLGGLGENALTWGSNLINQFAQGMWDAVGNVLSVLTDLANMISYWLSPGSPPRLLPDIDKWGTAAANEFFGGWGKADFSIFNDLSSTITGLIRSLPIGKGDQAGVIPNILGARQGIAAAVEELRNTGTITKETMDAIVGSVGTADDSVRGYLESMIRLQAANDVVKAAQDELNKVTKVYQDLLKPIDAEIAGITEEQQQLADEQKKSLLELVLKDPNATLSEKRQAQLEIERLDAEKRRRALLAEQKTAVDAAKDKVDAAKEAQEKAQEEFESRKALIAIQTEQNNLLKEQLRLLEALNGGGGGGGGGPKPKPGGGGKPGPSPFQIKPFDIGDFVPPDVLGKWDEFVTAIGALWDKLKEKFKPTIDAINLDLIPAFDRLVAAVKEKFPQMEDELAKTLAHMADAISDAGPTMVENLTGILNDLTEVWTEHGGQIIEAVGFTFRAAWTVAVSALNDIVASLALTSNAITTAISVAGLLWQGKWQEAWDRLKEGTQKALDIIQRTTDTNLTLLFDLFGLKWDEIKAQLITKWDEIGDKLAEKLQKISDDLNTTLTKWSEAIDTKFIEIGGFLDDLVADLQDMSDDFNTKLNKLSEDVNLKLAEIKRWFDEHLAAGVVAAFAGPITAVSNFWQLLKDVWEWLQTHIFHIDLPNVPSFSGQIGLSGMATAPAPAGGISSATYNTTSSGSTYTYAPTYVSAAPPPQAGFAQMQALFG